MTARLTALLIFPILLLATSSLAHEIAKQGFEIKHPWVRATAKGVPATAGYLRIVNTGKTADRLIGASLDGAAKGEVQETLIEDGVARMRRLEGGIEIAPGATLELKPGAAHLMFSGLRTTMDEDSYVDGTLEFEKAGAVRMEFFVEAAAEAVAPQPATGHNH